MCKISALQYKFYKLSNCTTILSKSRILINVSSNGIEN